MHLDDKETHKLLERVCATTIANQAILKCAISQMPLTVDNVLRHVEDFYDPANERLNGVTLLIEPAISSMLSSLPDDHAEIVAANSN